MTSLEDGYYGVLGLTFTCSPVEVELVYKRRIAELSAGRQDDAAVDAKCRKLETAYKVLSNTQSREAYDKILELRTYMYQNADTSGMIDAFLMFQVEQVMQPKSQTRLVQINFMHKVVYVWDKEVLKHTILFSHLTDVADGADVKLDGSGGSSNSPRGGDDMPSVLRQKSTPSQSSPLTEQLPGGKPKAAEVTPILITLQTRLGIAPLLLRPYSAREKTALLNLIKGILQSNLVVKLDDLLLPPPSLHKGVLEKRGWRGLKPYTRRAVMVGSSALIVFRNASFSSHITHCMHLHPHSTRLHYEAPATFGLENAEQTQSLFFRCASQDECLYWKDILSKLLMSVDSSQKLKEVKRRNSAVPYGGEVVDMKQQQQQQQQQQKGEEKDKNKLESNQLQDMKEQVDPDSMDVLFKSLGSFDLRGPNRVATSPDFPFDSLSEQARELYLQKEISRIPVPSALDFQRDYVSSNKPVVFTNAIAHWPALKKWTNDYLRKTIGEKSVSVDFTPTGHGDTVVGEKFVIPDQVNMKFNDYADMLEGKVSTRAVPYIQKQNGNFHTEFASLLGDIDEELQWATEAFGTSPDAVNFWMGDTRAVSSLHKDPYENIYCVIAGTKRFTLLPPTDCYWLGIEEFPLAQYKQRPDGSFTIEDDKEGKTVPWVPLDPDAKPTPEQRARFRHAQMEKITPLHVDVHAGEVLYLPAFWYHKVQQRSDDKGRVIAVNFWYDMQYDVKYNYFRFMEHVIQLKRAQKL